MPESNNIITVQMKLAPDANQLEVMRLILSELQDDVWEITLTLTHDNMRPPVADRSEVPPAFSKPQPA